MASLFWKDWDGFTQDPDEQREERRRQGAERCTPEKLLVFVEEHKKKNDGKEPTLADIKKKFGGILGAMVDFWELKRRGLL